MNVFSAFSFAIVAGLAFAAPAAAQHAGHNMADHAASTEGAPAKQDEAVYTTSGTIKSIDRGQSRLGIAHEAVPSLGWGAMTMNFTLESPDLAEGLKPGDKVRFDFRVKSGVSTIIDIEPR